MTTPREPHDLLTAYLAEGMDVLPDRVVDAVLDEVHRTRQRVVIGPRRTPVMLKNVFGAAAVIAVLVISGATLLGAWRPSENVGVPPASPSSRPSPSASPSISASPALLRFTMSESSLTAGVYESGSFSQPMTLTIPNIAIDFGPDESLTGFTYGDGHTVQIIVTKAEAAITIHDDFSINTDPCNPTADTMEVPKTPEAVGTWLHGLKGQFLEVTDQPDVTVDGRTAKVFDLDMGHACYNGDAKPPGNADIWFESPERHRIYAIPTGSDTILAITWSNVNNIEPINSLAERVLASLRFD